ncbi:MAG TPA: hypothetical protein VFS52_20725 [Steroidobacteraceae bacterium]|nr:hypothetical protein [Steroidobacteraceae bacterium]
MLTWQKSSDPQWSEISSCGYYRIASGPPHEAFHIEALWARPELIGSSQSLEGARRVCEFHAERGTVAA